MFYLLTVYLVVSSLYGSDDGIFHAGVTCQVRLVCYILLYAVHIHLVLAIDTSRHRGRCAEKWLEHVRVGNCSVHCRGSKSRSLLKRAEMFFFYVTHVLRNSRRGGHELSLDILARG